MQETEFLAPSSNNNKKDNIYYFKNRSSRLSYTGMMLAIAILVNFAGSKLLSVPFISFLKFDFALVVITATALWIGWRYAFLVILLLFLLGPSYGSQGYSLPKCFRSLNTLNNASYIYDCFLLVNKTFKENKIRQNKLINTANSSFDFNNYWTFSSLKHLFIYTMIF